MMTLALLFLLVTPDPPPAAPVQQGKSRDGGTSWPVEIVGGTGSASSPTAVYLADSGIVLTISLPDGGAPASDVSLALIAQFMRDGTQVVRVANLPPAPTRNPISGAAKVDGSGALQPISAVALPLPQNAAQEDGGTLGAILQAINTMTVAPLTFVQQPLSPFLQRCNAVRRTGCQP